MLRNFLVIAIRNFMRQREYSFINIFGLSTGLASALLILLWVNDELTMDTSYRDSDRIYRIVSNLTMTSGELLTWDITPGPLGEALINEVPEVEVAVRTMGNGAQLLQFEDKTFLERTLYADSTFFHLFNFTIVKGYADKLDKSSIVISEKVAKSLFGEVDPIGKVVRVSGTYDLTVAAVFEDIVRGSSIRTDVIIPFELYITERGKGFNWGNFDHPLYVRLHEGASADAVSEKMRSIVETQKKSYPEDVGNPKVEFYMIGLNDHYLNSHFINGVPSGGRIEYVRIFSIVAAFLVVIACINFMNMATARALGRAKEVGIRKVVGAQRQSLIAQFMGEALMITSASMILSLLIVLLCLPLFNYVVAKQITLDLTDPALLTGCFLIVLITTLLSGSYPAIFLSSYRPAAVLKGTAGAGSQKAFLRTGLVIFQFALTVVMVASALVVQRQISFIRNKNLGYDRKNVLTFFGRGDIRTRFDVFRAEAEKIPGVISVSRSNLSLVHVANQTRSVEWPGMPPDGNTFFRAVIVDHKYLETMGVKLLEGRYFTNSIADTAAYIVSKRTIEVTGIQNPLGSKFSLWGNSGTIVGVADDIHSRSMQEAIDPLIFMCRSEWGGNVVVRYEPESTADVVAGIEALARQFSPDYPFAFTFMDEDFERLYNTERTTGTLALGFTVIAIIISGLGLLALAAYTAERKKKEIGIRKTLGASAGTIIQLMTGEFARLSLIAAVIGCTCAWLLMSRFLEGYAYHVELTFDVFLLTTVIVTTISLATVSVLVAKAAIANPVNALRSE